jgi:hypothetical protein
LFPAWSFADSAPKLGFGGNSSSPASMSIPEVDATSCSGAAAAAAVSLRVTFGMLVAEQKPHVCADLACNQA